LLDEFFRRDWLMFQGFACRLTQQDASILYAGDDTQLRRLFKTMIRARLRELMRDLERSCHLRVVVSRARRRMHLPRRGLALELSSEWALGKGPTIAVQDKDDHPALRLAHLILNSFLTTWAQASVSPAHDSVRRHIAQNLGWTDLNADTLQNWKANMWSYHNPRVGLARDRESRPIAGYQRA
jgi:hypothetical protein